MKKSLMFVMVGILSFLGINSVSADTSYLNNYYNNYEMYSTLEENYSSVLDKLTTYYNENYSSNYPYYFIWANDYSIQLRAFKNNSFYHYSDSGLFPQESGTSVTYSYNISNSSYSADYVSAYYNTLLYYSNVAFTFVDSKNCSANINTKCADSITIPAYSNSELNVTYSEYNLSNNYKLPTYKSLVGGVYDPTPDFTDFSNMDITVLIKKPLEVLKTVWDAIISIFQLITQFIQLLPPTMQAFLYFSFSIAIVLGIIKILL